MEQAPSDCGQKAPVWCARVAVWTGGSLTLLRPPHREHRQQVLGGLAHLRMLTSRGDPLERPSVELGRARLRSAGTRDSSCHAATLSHR